MPIRHFVRPAAVSLAVAAASVGLGACGSSSGTGAGSGSDNGIAKKSPADIVKAAAKAVAAAKSVHINAAGTQGGKAFAADLELFSNGDASGSVTESGKQVQVISLGAKEYLKAGLSFWESAGHLTAKLAAKADNKWIEVSSANGGGLGSLSLKSLAASLQKPSGKLSRGGTKTINGQPTVGVIAKGHGTLYVASTGTPYPVQISGVSGTTLNATLTDWNGAKEPTAPKGAVPATSIH